MTEERTLHPSEVESDVAGPFVLCMMGTETRGADEVFYDFMDEWVEDNTMPTSLLIPVKRSGVNQLAREWADLMGIHYDQFKTTRAEADAELRRADQILVLKMESKTDIWVRRICQFGRNHSIPVSTYELVVNE